MTEAIQSSRWSRFCGRHVTLRQAFAAVTVVLGYFFLDVAIRVDWVPLEAHRVVAAAGSLADLLDSSQERPGADADSLRGLGQKPYASQVAQRLRVGDYRLGYSRYHRTLYFRFPGITCDDGVSLMIRVEESGDLLLEGVNECGSVVSIPSIRVASGGAEP